MAALGVGISSFSPHGETVLCHSVGVTPARFSVSSDSVDGHTVVVVTGEVDAHTADRVGEALESGIQPSARLVADLSAVTFMDSTGLGVFVTALKHLREQQGTLDLVITSPRVLKVFELTGLDVVIPIHEDRAAALAD